MVQLNKQRDLFRGDVTQKRLNEIKKENRDKTIYTKKGKTRSLLGYIQQVKKSKQKESQEERENMEKGGTQYWGFRNR